MVNKELYLRLVEERDLSILFLWANDAEVRKNAFCSDEILLEKHEKWFFNLLQDENQRQYILMHGQEPIGQIRITICGEEGEIHYSIDPLKRGLGYGEAMIDLIQKKARHEFPDIKRLIAKVKPSNTASAHCFEKNGFHEAYRQFEFDIEFGKTVEIGYD